MAKRGNRPTMKDVAKEAGVALGTVSKVVNGIPVGEEYRVRVEEAIQRLNYRVDSLAKGLRDGKIRAVAVMMPNLINPCFAALTNHIGRALAARKIHMVYFSTDYDPKREQEYIRFAEQQKVEGIICLSYNPNLQVSDDTPLVSIDRYFGAKIACVSSDNYGGGYLAAEKLWENGCRRVAILKNGSMLTHEPSKRRDGFIAGCEAKGLEWSQKILYDDLQYQGHVDFLKEHFHNGKLDFDGLFCATDLLAHQAIGTLKEMGLSVPKDVQVIGFDGCREFGDLEFTCSTIVQPVEAIASTCVNLILNTDPSQIPSLLCLPVHYEYGGTTRK